MTRARNPTIGKAPWLRRRAAVVRTTSDAPSAADPGVVPYARRVPTQDDFAYGEGRRPGADVRPLGFLAVGFAVLSLLLAPTYFLSVLAYLAAVPAVVLGVTARNDEPIRKMGTAALALALIAIVVASATLFLT